MSAQESSGSPSQGERPGVIAWTVAVSILALWLFTQHNDFAFFYHSDESAKVEQVLTKSYNFHHPMLLLGATQLWLHQKAGEWNEQRVVEAGRFVSAIFTAVAIGAFSLLAFVRAGWLAAIGAGLLLAFHQQLFELAHYMKEDPAMLVGIAPTFLTLAWYQRRPDWLAAICCGVACGVATSGKYLGAVAFLCAAPVLIWPGPVPGKQRALHVAMLFAGALSALVLINLPLLTDLATFRASFDREMEFVVGGSKGMTRRIPHSVYLNVFADNTTPIIWLLLGVYYVRFWQQRRAHDALAWVIALFPLVLTIAFSFSPKTNDRYYLPVTATFYYLAALALPEVSGMLPARWRAALTARAPLLGGALLLLTLAFEAPKFVDVYRAFRSDDRRELAEWIRAHVPADARIAQDERVMLPDARNRRRGRIVADLPQTFVSGKRYAAELGDRNVLRKALGLKNAPPAPAAPPQRDLEMLRGEGVTHVAVSESSYGRFFLSSLVTKDEYEDEHARHRAFYERLFREGELLFERPRGTVIYLHPGLRLYRLPPQDGG